MTSLLNSLGPELEKQQYGVSFAANRFSSTDDGAGAIYVYRPIGEPEFFFRGADRRPGICMQPLVFSGCVVDVEILGEGAEVEACYIVLGLARNPSDAAVALNISQKQFLLNIANQDELSAGQPCSFKWGSELRQYDVPTVAIRINSRPDDDPPADNSPPFKMGDDLVFRTTLQRIQKEVAGVLLMRYELIGGLQRGLYNRLRSDQLRKGL